MSYMRRAVELRLSAPADDVMTELEPAEPIDEGDGVFDLGGGAA